MNPWTRDKLVRYASSHFLVTELPTNWEVLPEQELMEFICNNLQEHITKDKPANHIWQLIIDLAVSLNKTFIL